MQSVTGSEQSRMAATMVTVGKEREVAIIPTDDGGFELVENGIHCQKLIFDKKHDRMGGKKMKKSDRYLIVFSLDEDGPYTFVTDKKQVMWVSKGSESKIPDCPKSEEHQEPEFKVDDVTDYVLKVVNKDSDSCFYRFSINMKDTSSGATVQYDPIYENKNGGLSPL